MTTAGDATVRAWRDTLATFQAMTWEEAALNVVFTFGVVAAAFVLGRYAPRLFRRTVHRLPGKPSAEKMVRASRFARLLSHLVHIALVMGAVLIVAEIWGLSLLTWLYGVLGPEGTRTLIRLGLLALAAIAAYEAAGFVIGRSIARLARRSEGRRRRGQLNTLGPLLIGLAHAVIGVIVVMMVLSELGVKIGPLLAGAGVVGIAVGFGAQTIVKDLLTGAFLIVEDIIAVGDVVRIGDCGGLVEKMTLRTIRLRDFDGTLHVLPYGEAQVVHNMTKSFSYYVFDLQVSYEADIDKALEIMRATGAELQADPAFAEMILEPIEVVGVEGLGESGVNLKARIKTRPLDQWNVGREYNRRIKLAFDAAGIEIPYPHMKLVLPEPIQTAAATH
jgi:small conductance mechanosensitive channel